MSAPEYLLDSSVCVAILRNQAGLHRLPAPERAGIPIIVAAELWTGVEKNRATHPHHESRLGAFLGLFPLLDFDLEAARHYADIRARLEAKGVLIGPLDLLIAAQARSLDATLITGNGNEFKRVPGLKVQSWKPA